MRVLVAGPESSGTRMLCQFLIEAGAEVIHSSPAFKRQEPQSALKYRPSNYDAAVLIVRHSMWNARSMEKRERRAGEYENAYHQINADIFDVIAPFLFDKSYPLYIVTYEALIHEQPHSLASLCEVLGLETPNEYTPILDGNEKFYGEGWEGDDRTLAERLT